MDIVLKESEESIREAKIQLMMLDDATVTRYGVVDLYWSHQSLIYVNLLCTALFANKALASFFRSK